MTDTTTEMNTDKKMSYKTVLLNSKAHSTIIGFLAGILMLALYVWIAFGFVNLLTNLYHSFPNEWSHGSEKMIEDVVIILAALELIRIFQSYLLIGRVKVSFIVDVSLVVLIGELISFWYRKAEMNDILLSLFVILVLVIIRVVTTKYSPDNRL